MQRNGLIYADSVKPPLITAIMITQQRYFAENLSADEPWRF
jgi:hypothetical protein